MMKITCFEYFADWKKRDYAWSDAHYLNNIALDRNSSIGPSISLRFCLDVITAQLHKYGDTRWRIWSRHCATNRKIAG
jgi:hypothetical protein